MAWCWLPETSQSRSLLNRFERRKSMKKLLLLLAVVVAQAFTCAQSDAALVFTAVQGAQVGNSLSVSLFVRATNGEIMSAIDISTIQLSAGKFVQTSPTSAAGVPSFGNFSVGTIGSGNLTIASYLAFDPVADPTLGFASISYTAVQAFPAATALAPDGGLFASWDIDVTGLSGPTVGLTLAGFSTLDSSFANDPGVSFNGGDGLGNYSFSFTAVPEPSSMILLGLAGVGGVAVRRFRKSRVA
jgi:hypothetical protein